MTIDEILDMMDELLDKAVSVPFTQKKSLVEVEKLREYIDGIRYNMPTEIKRAKEMVFDRTQIIEEAKKESDRIIKRAEERAKLLVNEEEIVKAASIKANELLTNAQTKEREIRCAMCEKMDEMLNETECMLNKNLTDIKQTRVLIHSTGKKK
ncbi:MAG: ATPase [Oscillospiraceae bacterium]|jgi:cell division septum initiation protein DivIVA